MRHHEKTTREWTTAAGERPTKPTAPVSAYVTAIVTGLAVAAAVGAVAMAFHQERPWLAFTVFALCTAGPCLALSWFVFVSRYTVTPDRHVEENVEHRWYERAVTGAFHDVLMVCGLGLVALSVTGLDMDAGDVLLIVLLVCGVDTAVRYRVISRREA